MRILVTGAAGQVGREVCALVEAAPQHELLAAERSQLDLANRDSVLGAVCANTPELIVNCAAFTAVDACESEAERAYAVNALGVRHLLDAARRVGAHVVHVSTDYVFDGTKDTPYHEWDTPNPASVYGRSKLGGELELAGSGATIVRTSWVCGFHGPNMVKTVLRLCGGDGPLRFVSDQVGHPSFADDLAAMLLRLGVDRRPGTFHVTNHGAVSWFEFVRAVVAAAGGDVGRVEPITTAELQPPRPAPRPANSVLDNAALRLSGIEPPGHFEDALRRLVVRLQS
ncbi:MAG: dTDP-4-dehydrorhamnose reductase [Acidimicrobiia bacterium]|nr:dTDP-4-dehydrorhamnose reductase [Acidimicrobiia bacterium]